MKSLLSLCATALITAACISSPLSARICQGLPGELTAVDAGDLSTGQFSATTTYSCFTQGDAYVLAEPRCFVAGFDLTASALVIYQAEDGSLAEVDTVVIASGSITALSSFLCYDAYGTPFCFLVSVGTGGNDTNRTWELSFSDGSISTSTALGTTALLAAVTSFTCQGECYIVTGGDDPVNTNHLFTFDPTGPTVTDLGQFDIGYGDNLLSLASFQCEGIWWVVSAGEEGTGNDLYKIDPCAYDTPRLVLEQDQYLDHVYELGGSATVAALEPFFWNCTWYVVGVWSTDTAGLLKVFEVEIDQYGNGQLVEVASLADNGNPILDVTVLACGCNCYVITAGPGSATIGNRVFEFDGALTEVQEYSIDSKGLVVSYDCCECSVVAFGQDATYNSNELFVMHSPIVTVNNDCFCFDEGSGEIQLDLFANDCGDFDAVSVRFFADEDLYDEFGGNKTDFTQVLSAAGGTLRVDFEPEGQYATSVSIFYTPPTNAPADFSANPDCFYYTLDDACNCFDCGKVTIFVKPVLTTFDAEVALGCDDGYGTTATATVTNATSYDFFTFVWLNDTDMVLKIDSGVTTSDSPTLFQGTYRVHIINENDLSCKVVAQFDVEPCPGVCPDCDLDISIDLTCDDGTSSGEIMVSVNSGGVGPTYSVSLDGGYMTLSPATFSNLAAGSYEVTVVDNGNSLCQSTTNVEIIECSTAGCGTCNTTVIVRAAP